MPVQTCSCGAKYRLPDDSIGKKAKCKKCGASFRITGAKPERAAPPAAPPPSRDALWDDLASAAGGARVEPALPRVEHETASERAAPTRRSERTRAASPGVAGAFVADVIKTLQFPFNASNAAVFLVVWIIRCIGAVLLPVAPCFGFIGQLIVAGWYCSFRFDVVGEAAKGERGLPNLGVSEGWGQSIVMPLLKWVGTWALVLLPSGAYLFDMVRTGRIEPDVVFRSLTQGLSGLIAGQAGEATTFLILVYAGLALWPMVLLCVVLDGFEAVLRLPQFALTILRTLPGYVLTVLFVFGAFYIETVVNRQISGAIARATGGSLVAMLGGLAVSIVVGLLIAQYFEIVALRTIGHYYRHYRQKFAYAWE